MPARDPAMAPTVALAIPPPYRARVLTPESLDRLAGFARVVDIEGDSDAIGEQLPRLLPSVDACLTGWGTPPLPRHTLLASPRMKIIAHTAGSIRALIPLEALERGVIVCHAADIIAKAVAECVVLLILTGLRQLHLCDRALKDGQEWGEAASRASGHLLSGHTVGLIGCGKVARRLITLLKPFDVTILVYDPYLAADEAQRIGVTIATLHDVMAQSDIVSNHAPTTPETRHLIGPHEFALLRDNAIFINTARAWSVDDEALSMALRRRRIWAALDVFQAEPLPLQSELRRRDNAFLTPHQAAASVETFQEQGAAMVEDLSRFFRGEQVLHRVLPEAYATMA